MYVGIQQTELWNWNNNNIWNHDAWEWKWIVQFKFSSVWEIDLRTMIWIPAAKVQFQNLLLITDCGWSAAVRFQPINCSSLSPCSQCHVQGVGGRKKVLTGDVDVTATIAIAALLQSPWGAVWSRKRRPKAVWPNGFEKTVWPWNQDMAVKTRFGREKVCIWPWKNVEWPWKAWKTWNCRRQCEWPWKQRMAVKIFFVDESGMCAFFVIKWLPRFTPSSDTWIMSNSWTRMSMGICDAALSALE